MFQLHNRRIRERIEMPHDLQITAVARALLLDHYDAVERFLLARRNAPV